jgi:hypothetical protein
MEKTKNNYKILVGKLKEEEIIWKLWNKWVDNIEMDLNN